jgi:hypothetical protein
MSPEELQRMMQFLLQQQAQFDANQAKFDASQAKFDANQAKFDANQAKFDANQAKFDASLQALSGKTDRIAEGLIGLTSIVGQLAASQERTDAQFREADGRLKEHIDQVESHLNLVIGMFERHLRDDHGRAAS